MNMITFLKENVLKLYLFAIGKTPICFCVNYIPNLVKNKLRDLRKKSFANQKRRLTEQTPY
jgi:hypothetical protein